MDDQKFIKDYEYAIKVIFRKNPEAVLMHMHTVTLKVTKLYTLPLNRKFDATAKSGMAHAIVQSVLSTYTV